MVSKLVPAVTLATLLLAAPASAATLTITPDKSTYLVGETITLSVFGDAQGAQGLIIVGRLLFSGSLGTFVDASQEALTSFNGLFAWTTGTLTGGAGFADAFNQLCCLNPTPVDGPLLANVSLLATAPGVLGYDWLTDGSDESLRFFGLSNASGGSVTIVPEPATGMLVALGLVMSSLAWRRGRS